MTAPVTRPRRPRRSREEVSQALIDAAAALFAERPSGHLTVRDIAARADVNPALIHRYFGTKQNLLRAAFATAQQRIATIVAEMPDVIDGAALVFHTSVTEKEFVACLARARLDGVLDDLAPESPAIAGLVRRFADERERRGSAGRN
ncbi:MAG: TetR family transcriptional regulator, partial [Thermoleophilia bacterium]|nr:TetR family transcriptional regulator [Thermoleophilia bacterium]